MKPLQYLKSSVLLSTLSDRFSLSVSLQHLEEIPVQNRSL